MRRYVMVAGAVLFAAALAVAQQITSPTLTGNEVVTAALGGPGGSSIFVPISELRNAQGVQLTALTTGALTLPNTTATLITTAVVSGALAVTTPPNPWDGEIFELVNGSSGNNTATVTLTANTGQTVIGGAIATQNQNTSVEWRYVQSTTTWYKMR